MPRECECERAECRLCWLFWNDHRYNKIWGGDGNLRPSIFVKATNLFRSVAKHATTGGKKVTEGEKQARLDVCKACVMYSEDRCLKCGCKLSVKASWKAEECPLGLWKPVVNAS